MMSHASTNYSQYQPPCPIIETSNVQVTPYRVSTITVNGCINCHVKLDLLFEHLDMCVDSDSCSSDCGFIYVELKHPKRGLISRGINPRAKRPKASRKKVKDSDLETVSIASDPVEADAINFENFDGHVIEERIGQREVFEREMVSFIPHHVITTETTETNGTTETTETNGGVATDAATDAATDVVDAVEEDLMDMDAIKKLQELMNGPSMDTSGDNVSMDEEEEMPPKNGGSKFDNQVTVVYRMAPNYMPNIKIFRNGNIQMTGVRNLEHGALILDTIVNQLITIKTRFINITYIETDALTKAVTTNVSPFKSGYIVRMINSDFAVNIKVERRLLHEVFMKKYSCICSYEPETYPGVKLHYFWNDTNTVQDGICRCAQLPVPVPCSGKGSGYGPGNCKRVTVSTFHSGKILITGSNNFFQVNDAYRFTCKVMDECKDIIAWNERVANPIVKRDKPIKEKKIKIPKVKVVKEKTKKMPKLDAFITNVGPV